MVLHGIDDYWLMALSIRLSICGAYATLELTSLVARARGWRRLLWLSCGAIVIGVGTFATHFSRMLPANLAVAS